jgi:hypothetical protein
MMDCVLYSLVFYIIIIHKYAVLIALQIGLTLIYCLYLDSLIYCLYLDPCGPYSGCTCLNFYIILDKLSYLCIMYLATKIHRTEQTQHLFLL